LEADHLPFNVEVKMCGAVRQLPHAFMAFKLRDKQLYPFTYKNAGLCHIYCEGYN
jgi:hypothetical protein